MRRLRMSFARVRDWFRRGRLERQLDEELASHLQMLVDEGVAGGLSEQEARRQAKLQLGGVEQTREAVRDQRVLRLETLWHDIRHARRALSRNPGFSAAVVVLLAVGIGGSTFVYSVAEALLLRPIPYPHPETLCLVSTFYSSGGSTFGSYPHVGSWKVFEQLREGHSGLETIAAYAGRSANVVGDGWSERIRVVAVTHDYLALAGARPAMGRGFVDAEFRSGAEPVALISDGLWRRRFAKAPDVLGRTVSVDDRPYTVVGVLPPDFRSIEQLETGGEVWQDTALGVVAPATGDPTAYDYYRTGPSEPLRILARLRAGQSLETARRQMAVVSARIPQPRSIQYTVGYTLTPLSEALTPGVTERLVLLAVAVVVLFLVACANAANLMLERSESRRRETGIRAALGATTKRLAGEALLETGLLGGAGGVLGVGLAAEAIQIARVLGGGILTGLDRISLSWQVVTFALAASAAASILTGLAPCLRLLRTDLARWLPASGSWRLSSRRGALPSSLVVAQVGLSVGLVVVGSLLAKDFARLAAVDIGYRPEGVLSAEVSLSRERHGRDGRQFLDALVDRVRALPGVTDVAVASPCPGLPFAAGVSARVEGTSEPSLPVRYVSPSFFSLLGIPIVAGRPFTDAGGRRTEWEVVVNKAFAERYWGSAKSALGRHVTIGIPLLASPSDITRTHTVVGVSRDFLDAWGRIAPEMYLTYAGVSRGAQIHATLLVRAPESRVTGLARSLAQTVQRLDPYQPLANVRALSDIAKSRLARQRMLLALMTVFSVLATLLAAVGVYGLLAYAVTHRTQEIGVRLALGGSRRDVVGLVLRQTLRVVLRGIIAALPLTVAATWSLAAQFFGITDTDFGTYAWSVGIVVAAGALASVLPAWRATRVDPVVALREE